MTVAATAGTYNGILSVIPGLGQVAKLILSGAEVAVLTTITKEMCGKITEVYKYSNIKGMSQFVGVVVGAVGGLFASKIAEFIPGVAMVAASIATFSLHVLTRTVITAVCELIDEGILDESFIIEAGG